MGLTRELGRPSIYDFDHADCLYSLSIRPAAAAAT